MPRKKIGANRSFLNEPFMTSLTSNISYQIEVTTWRKELAELEDDYYDSADIKFSFSDCNRTVSLDFDISDKDEMRNSLFKIDTIIDVMTKMKADLKEARLEVLKGHKKYKEIKPEK